MLQELLANDKDISLESTEAHKCTSKPQVSHSNGYSSDSISSRNSNSLPRYLLHGLVSTETQSQQYEDDEAMYEGSQKENIGAAGRNNDLTLSDPLPVFRPPSPHASSSRNAPNKVTHVNSRNSFLSTNRVRPWYCAHRMYCYTKIFRKPLRKFLRLFPFNPLSQNQVPEQIQPNKPLVTWQPLNRKVVICHVLVLHLVLAHRIHSPVIPLKIPRNSFLPSPNSLLSLYLNWGVFLSQWMKALIQVAPPIVQCLPTHQATSPILRRVHIHKAEY